MDVLFTRKEVREYQGSRILQGREGEDIPMNSKYPLLSPQNEDM